MPSEKTIRQFLEEVSSGTPAPGGGSVAALAGAMSAALVSMVANLTLGRKNYIHAEPAMKKCLEGAEALRKRLACSVEEDAESFMGLIAAYKIARENPEHESGSSHTSRNGLETLREKKIQEALERTIGVPLSVAERCVALLQHAVEAAEKGNQNAITDTGVAALMADAALKGALLNVRINIRSITDEGKKNALLASVRELSEKGKVFLSRALSAVEAKVG